MTFPAHLRYTSEHEWIDDREDVVRIGVTDFAQSSLGDIVFVDLPAAGTRVEVGEVCGELESTKSVSDLYAPVTGEVVEANQAVADDPALVNSDPYGQGWLFTVRAESVGELLSADEYAKLAS